MSHKAHAHKHTPARHKAPHYGAAHYVTLSGRRVGIKPVEAAEAAAERPRQPKSK